MTILLSSDHEEYIDHARTLLDYFVKKFDEIYGAYLMPHNVHSLLHICDDYEMYEPLDCVIAFPYEKYMGHLKKMLRKPGKPLEQVIKRYVESNSLLTNTSPKNEYIKYSGLHNNGHLIKDVSFKFQYKTLTIGNVTLKIHIEVDSYFYTIQGVFKLVNILKQF